MENDILNNAEYKEMLAQLEDLRDYYHQYKDDDSGTKDFNALDKAITYLKHYYPLKINDYRRIYQIIYKLIENKD